MTNRVLYTTGTGEFLETQWTAGSPKNNEIYVASVMTGVCRSDIDMMQGNFGPLPLSMQGHEGLARVLCVGDSVTDVEVGDYVATRGEPAYADSYICRAREYVKVPEAAPKYILEPVACGITVVQQDIRGIAERSGAGKRLLIIGTGFLAWVAYNTLQLNHLEFDVDVLGSSNKDLWQDRLISAPVGRYDVVIDLGGSDIVFKEDIVNNNAIIIFGVQKTITTDFGSLLWKACTISFPSPRTDGFYKCMQDAAYWIENGDLNVDRFWTKGYNRTTEWQQAFTDGVNRPAGYNRGYIYWN